MTRETVKRKFGVAPDRHVALERRGSSPHGAARPGAIRPMGHFALGPFAPPNFSRTPGAAKFLICPPLKRLAENQTFPKNDPPSATEAGRGVSVSNFGKRRAIGRR